MRQVFLAIMAVIVAMAAMAQRNVVYIEDFEIEPGNSITVPLMMANCDSTRGIQVNLTLPEGLRLIDRELTQYSREYDMEPFGNYKNGVWTIGMIPSHKVCFPPADTAIMELTFNALPEFNGGEIIVWRQRGATMNNKTIFFDDDTTTVTVPQASIIELKQQEQPVDEHFFNMEGQPIQSLDSVPMAIQVATWPDGRRSSRKVAVVR